MRGNFIPLITPGNATTLIVAEGIENTLTAYFTRPEEHKNAAFWAGVSLSNMAGKMKKSGKRGVMSGLPDLESEDPSFVPPPWVKRLIFIQDGDSDPVTTQAQLLCGMRRAKALRPEIEVAIVAAPEGYDLNDVLNGKHKEEKGQE